MMYGLHVIVQSAVNSPQTCDRDIISYDSISLIRAWDIYMIDIVSC